MIKNIDCFIQLKKLEYKANFEKNRKKRLKKQEKIVKKFNKNNNYIYYFGIDKVYELENLHSKINWFKYYLELYLNDLFTKYESIKNNKIDLK